jgi:hypothetical protein
MKRFINLLLCVASVAGLIWALVLTYQGSRPCGSDGCLIHILLILALIVFAISAPVFYFTFKRERKYYQEKKLKSN